MGRIPAGHGSALCTAHSCRLDSMLGTGDERVRSRHRDRILPDDCANTDLRALHLVRAFCVVSGCGSADRDMPCRVYRAADDLRGMEAV